MITSGRLRLRHERAQAMRRRAEWIGRAAEWIAVFAMLARGYRVLARRWRVAAGEIDIIAVRGGRLAFVEVKYRADLSCAHDCVRPRQMRRLHAAAAAFVTRHRGYGDHERGFDAVYLAPWRWPLYARDQLQPAIRSAR